MDGEINPKLQSIHVEHVSLRMAKFTQDGREIVAIGARQGFFVYDITKGKMKKVDVKGIVLLHNMHI